jgi:hypothetical protein
LQRFDDRTATDFDFGWARDINEDFSLGARFFFEQDALDQVAEGSLEEISRVRLGPDLPSSALYVVGRDVSTYSGPGEDAFKQQNIGGSISADWHQWSDQSLNARADVFYTTLDNPGSFIFSLDPDDDNVLGAQVNLVRLDDFTTIFGDQALNNQATGADYPFGDLINDRENRTTTTSSFGGIPVGLATASVDDDRDGVGLGGKVEYDREWAGGDTRAWVAALRKPYDIDARIRQSQLIQNTFWWNGDGLTPAVPGDFEATYTTLEDNRTVTRSGDLTWTTFEGGARWTKDLSSTVSFGGGLIGTKTKASEEYSQRTVSEQITDRFVDGNGDLGNDALATSGFPTTSSGGSFTERQTRTASTTVLDVNDEHELTTVRLPVGLQFHFAREWTWNMGSLHEVNWLERETGLSTPADQAGQTTVTVTDFGTSETVTPDTTPIPSSNRTVSDETKTHTTTFFYGLEWDATENLSFYINGMFDALGDGTPHPAGLGTNFGRQINDVEFWRSLAISAKIIL